MWRLRGSRGSGPIIQADEMEKIIKRAVVFKKAGKAQKLNARDQVLLDKIRDATLAYEKEVVVNPEVFKSLKEKMKQSWGERLMNLINTVSRSMKSSFRAVAIPIANREKEESSRAVTKEKLQGLTQEEFLKALRETNFTKDSDSQKELIKAEQERRKKGRETRGKELVGCKLDQFESRASKLAEDGNTRGLDKLFRGEFFERLPLDKQQSVLQTLKKKSKTGTAVDQMLDKRIKETPDEEYLYSEPTDIEEFRDTL